MTETPVATVVTKQAVADATISPAVALPILQPAPQKQIRPNTGTQYETDGHPTIHVPGIEQSFETDQESKDGNRFPTFRSIVVKSTSNGAGGAVATTQKIFNPDIFPPATTNGSGALSMGVAYQDNASGLLVSIILSKARAGIGYVCFGVQAECSLVSGGTTSPDSSGLSALAPVFQAVSIKGNPSPIELEPQEDHSRADQDKSIEVMKTVTNISRWIYFQFLQNVDATAGHVYSTTLTFYFTRKFRS